jgi:hypothetical protein
MGALFAVEIDLGDGRGFRRARRGEGIPQEVAEVAKEHLLHVANELAVTWDVRVVEMRKAEEPDRR